jgi:hypothetical protein
VLLSNEFKLGPCDLESEFGGVLSEQLDLLVAVSLFVVLGPLVNVSLTVFQHAVDESGEAMGHRRDGAPSLVRRRRYWAPR